MFNGEAWLGFTESCYQADDVGMSYWIDWEWVACGEYPPVSNVFLNGDTVRRHSDDKVH